MKFLNFLRWTFFIPLGLVASGLAGALATVLLKFIGGAGYFGGANWYVWLINGAVTAYSLALVSFYIAPKITRFCKWIIVGLMLFIGIPLGILLPATNIERIQMIAAGVPMTLMGFIVAFWSPEQIKQNLGLPGKKES